MRLLHCSKFEFEEFFENIPQYAILSHTWKHGEEFSYQELCTLIKARKAHEGDSQDRVEIENRSGYSKIISCCQQAFRDGFDHVWIDTCCIDKTSSSELSEAINSMYQLFKGSAICYAYLADVFPGKVAADPDKEDQFVRSRWFTRGWTLQELLAPAQVIFFAQDWSFFGTRSSEPRRSVPRQLPDAVDTPSDRHNLGSSDDRKCGFLQHRSKMSWAADRRTTRIEDVVYSLLGLFEVNMPLLYGEGNRAFRRLQEEIIKNSDDQTIFAWRNDPSESVPVIGFLAPSPAAFKGSSDIILSPPHILSRPYSITNKGLQIEADLFRIGENVLVLLECTRLDLPKMRVGVYVEGEDLWSYTDTLFRDDYLIPGVDFNQQSLSASELEANSGKQVPEINGYCAMVVLHLLICWA